MDARGHGRGVLLLAVMMGGEAVLDDIVACTLRAGDDLRNHTLALTHRSYHSSLVHCPARFLYRVVDSPMEIGDAFDRFEHLLCELEGMGYGREKVLLDATGGTTPMRLGAALAAITRGIEMVHQRVPQMYVDGRWERDESREVEVAPMGNPLEATGLLREGQRSSSFTVGTTRQRHWSSGTSLGR